MHCILWLHVGSGTHQNTYTLTIYTVCSIKDWVNLIQFVHSREAGTPAYAEAVALGSACDYLQHLGMKAIATRHWLRELVKVLRIQKNEVKIHFSNWLGGNGFMVVLYPVYTVCAEFIDFSCFLR